MVSLEGETLQSQGYLRVMVNWVVPTEVGYGTLLTLIVTTLFIGATAGAWYRPVLLIVPTVLFPPRMSLTHQVIVFGEIGTYAVHCSVLPISMLELLG